MSLRSKARLDDLLLKDFDGRSTARFKEYMLRVMKYIRHASIERRLEARFYEAKKKIRVERKLSDRNLFDIRAYILAHNVDYKSPAGIPVKTKLVMNSAIYHKGNGRMGIFLRLASMGTFMLGCRLSRTFIAHTELDYEELKGEVKVKAEPVLYPMNSSECIEDPRVDPDDPRQLYHVRGYYMFNKVYGMDTAVLMFRAGLDENLKPVELEPVHLVDGDETVIIRDSRDTFPLSREAMVMRPWLTSIGVGAVFVGPREGATVDFEKLEPVPELLPMHDETKTGGNASVKIGSNEYLVIFHAVEIYGMYPHYAAVFSKEGELLGVTPEPIIPPLPEVYHGARPETIFVCGATLYKDQLVVSAGKDDEILLIMEAPLQRILDSIKWIRG